MFKRFGIAALVGVAVVLAVLGLNWVVSHAPWIIGVLILLGVVLICVAVVGFLLLSVVSLFWWIITGKDIFNPALDWLSKF